MYANLNCQLKNTKILFTRSHHKVFPKSLNHNIKYKFNANNGKGNKILFALTVTGLLKFLGLTEEDESSELIQILKRGELTYIVKTFIFFVCHLRCLIS